jgi:acyl carrier protein
MHDWEAQARAAATTLRMLDDKGELRALSSLELLDYIVELEQVTGVEIPTTRAGPEQFASLAAVGAMLRELDDERDKA